MGTLAAAAQSPDTSSAVPGDSDVCLKDAACRELCASARSLSQASQYDAALVAYQSAYARSKAFWLLVNIARMQQKLGRIAQAMTTYQRILEDNEAQKDLETQSKAREYLQQTEQEALVQKVALAPKVVPLPAQAALSIRPLYKRWWLWTAVGSAVAAGAVGLAIGLTPRSPTVPQGVGVYNTGF